MNEVRKTELVDMLRIIEQIWDGHLGDINIPNHRIELLDGARPISQQPCRTGMRAKEFETKEIEHMLQDILNRTFKSK